MKKFNRKLKDQIAFALVRHGRRLGGFDNLENYEPGMRVPKRDSRFRVRTTLTVVFTHHAIRRYGERTGRELDFDLQMKEIRRVWPHAVISPQAPKWYYATGGNDDRSVLYAQVADMLIPLCPYKDADKTLLATTVLSPLGERGVRRVTRGNIPRLKNSRERIPLSNRIGPRTMTPSERRKAILGSFAAMLVTAGPLLVFVLIASGAGISNALQAVLFFVFLGAATKAYLILSDRFTRPSERDTSNH
jgi:hypothetical protein